MSTHETVILSGARTPIGAYNGALSSVKAHELGSLVIREALKRSGVDANDITDVFIGHVYVTGQGPNTARQAAIKAGIPVSVPATTVNMLCGSGLQSVLLGSQAIRTGDSRFVVVGGHESMSQTHHSVYLKNAGKLEDIQLKDTLFNDGLTDAFHKIHMGVTAENVAKQWSISREEQDQFALGSQQKAAVAQQQGLFDEEIIPVTISGRKPVTVTKDEFPRNDTTIDSLKKLRPCFIRDESGTVTPGNASGVNDGAAALILASKSAALEKGLTPLARIVSNATVGVDPLIMGIGPIPAIQTALKKAGWTVDDVDYFELNEAFAAQSIAVARELKIPADKLNKHGGAIALGHPVGSSGARILVTLLNILKRNKKTKGVAALCVGGGQGVAVCIELL